MRRNKKSEKIEWLIYLSLIIVFGLAIKLFENDTTTNTYEDPENLEIMLICSGTLLVMGIISRYLADTFGKKFLLINPILWCIGIYFWPRIEGIKDLILCLLAFMNISMFGYVLPVTKNVSRNPSIRIK